MVNRDRHSQYTLIDDPSEIPAFADEREEHAFWATHGWSEKALMRAEPLPDGLLPPPRRERKSPQHVRPVMYPSSLGTVIGVWAPRRGGRSAGQIVRPPVVKQPKRVVKRSQ